VFVGQVACLAAALARAVRSRAESEGAATCGPPVFADPSIEEELGYAKYERWLVGRDAESVRRLIADLWELTHARVWVETMERLRLSPSLVMHDGGLGRAWWGLVTIHAALHGEEGPDFFAAVMRPQTRPGYVAEWPLAERRRVRDHLDARLDGASSLRACLDLAARLPQECARRNALEADRGW
jgi:hypothetical protein